jgi:hypothetical protein
MAASFGAGRFPHGRWIEESAAQDSREAPETTGPLRGAVSSPQACPADLAGDAPPGGIDNNDRGFSENIVQFSERFNSLAPTS